MRALLDTSFILWAAERGLDLMVLLDEVLPYPMEKVTPVQVVRELEAMCKDRSTKRSRLARTAMRIADHTVLLHAEGDGDADRIILALASGGGFVVATMDSDLRKRLRAASAPVIYFKDDHPQLVGIV
ncbi:MAG: PIN domain-containing protein [Candidatus Geothermarchaeales archaeon]